jgi:hypothetical protein
MSGDASPETGCNVLFDRRSAVLSGTSAVARLWAALIALLNQQRGSNIGLANLALPRGRREQFQRYHRGRQPQLFGGTRLGPLHRPWLAQRKPVVADFPGNRNRRHTIGTRSRIPQASAHSFWRLVSCGFVTTDSDAQVSILRPGLTVCGLCFRLVD